MNVTLPSRLKVFGASANDGAILTTSLFCACFGIVLALFPRRSSSGKIQDLGGIPIITAWTFFSKRYDFIRGHLKNAGLNMFRFRVLQHQVVSASGEDYRRLFFNEHGLKFQEAYDMMMGGFPDLKDMEMAEESTETEEGRNKRLAVLLHKDKVTESLPTLLDDVNRRMDGWGKAGVVNPFKQVYDLVLQMTIRMATCRELAEDLKAIEKLALLYWDIEKSGTPTSVLLPWFPSPAKRRGKEGTLALYMLLNSYVDLRRKASVPSQDTIDILISRGDSNEVIVGTMMSIIFAGLINTGISSCWALIYLGVNKDWKRKAEEELKKLLENHAGTSSSEPLHKRLSGVPLNAWENELPLIDLIIRETLRLTISTSLLRRNGAKDIEFQGAVIKPGDFLVYSVADAHLNPDIYTEPNTFNPDRYLEGNEEDKKQTYAFLAWGAGRHPCTGVRFAKLEMKLILAMVLLGYEYELVDKSGRFPQVIPQPDRNDIQQARPLGDPCYLQVKRVVE